VETETPKRASRGGGRPAIGPLYALAMPEEWIATLDAVARDRQTSRAAVIRQALAETYPALATVDTTAPRYAPRMASPE
jgi:hypothetical protein